MYTFIGQFFNFVFSFQFNFCLNFWFFEEVLGMSNQLNFLFQC